MRTDLSTRPAEKLAFFHNHLMLFVSRTPDAITDVAIGLRELPDNTVLARCVARLYGRPQPNRLTDFELVRRHALASRAVRAEPLRTRNRPLEAKTGAIFDVVGDLLTADRQIEKL